MLTSCPHLDTIAAVAPPARVCEECVAAGRNDWHFLRQCMVCGGTRCCDSSPATHASKHSRASHHAIVRSAEPGQDWLWCFACEASFRATPDGYVALDG